MNKDSFSTPSVFHAFQVSRLRITRIKNLHTLGDQSPNNNVIDKILQPGRRFGLNCKSHFLPHREQQIILAPPRKKHPFLESLSEAGTMVLSLSQQVLGPPTLCWQGRPSNSRKCTRLGSQARSSYAASLPRNEPELLSQIQTSVQQALTDGKSLLEVQFPVDQVSRGDCIATSELNANMQAMRKFCEVFEWLGQAERVRVFFPDAGIVLAS